MSASLVRKALDETSLAADEKLEQLSRGSKSKSVNVNINALLV